MTKCGQVHTTHFTSGQCFSFIDWHHYWCSEGFHTLSFEVPSPLGKFTKVTNVGQHTVTLVCEDR